MPFGNAVGSIKDLKKQTAKSSGTWLKYIPKNGALTVRFLTEPDEWLAFQEVFDSVRRKSYPVPDEGMPGYPDADDRVSTRYVANVLLVDEDKVVPLQMPKDLVNQLVVRYEKHDTVCDRDYELFRSGEGLETVYGLTPEAPMARKITKYKPLDLEQVLQDAYESVWGSNALTAKPKRGAAKSKVTAGRALKRRQAVEEVEEEDPGQAWADIGQQADDDDDADAIHALQEAADTADLSVEDYETWVLLGEALDELVADEADEPEEEAEEEEPEAEEEEPEAEEEAEEEGEAEEGEEFYTKAELNAMPIGALRGLARDASIATTGKNKKALVDALMGGGDEEMEDEPF